MKDKRDNSMGQKLTYDTKNVCVTLRSAKMPTKESAEREMNGISIRAIEKRLREIDKFFQPVRKI